MRNLKARVLWIGGLSIVCVSGCAAPRTVLVPPGEPVKIGPKVKGKVYVLTDNGWELSANPVVIPEGWYALPPKDKSK